MFVQPDLTTLVYVVCAIFGVFALIRTVWGTRLLRLKDKYKSLSGMHRRCMGCYARRHRAMLGQQTVELYDASEAVLKLCKDAIVVAYGVVWRHITRVVIDNTRSELDGVGHVILGPYAQHAATGSKSNVRCQILALSARCNLCQVRVSASYFTRAFNGHSFRLFRPSSPTVEPLEMSRHGSRQRCRYRRQRQCQQERCRANR